MLGHYRSDGFWIKNALILVILTFYAFMLVYYLDQTVIVVQCPCTLPSLWPHANTACHLWKLIGIWLELPFSFYAQLWLWIVQCISREDTLPWLTTGTFIKAAGSPFQTPDSLEVSLKSMNTECVLSINIMDPYKYLIMMRHSKYVNYKGGGSSRVFYIGKLRQNLAITVCYVHTWKYIFWFQVLTAWTGSTSTCTIKC